MTTNKISFTHMKEFCEKMCQSCQISWNFYFYFLKSSYFEYVVKISGILFLKYKIDLLSLTYSQIWLIPLVDDLPVWQHQKFGEKKKTPTLVLKNGLYCPKYIYVYVKYKYLDIVAKPQTHGAIVAIVVLRETLNTPH